MTPVRRIREFLQSARGGLWFWPMTLGVLAAVGAELLVRLDRVLDDANAQATWVFSGDDDAARSVLSTIATATLTVLGVTLTITLAVLALTASAYSPRVIRRFMRDQLLQIMLGVFVAAVVFALVTLRLVTQESVPRITVTVAVALAFVAIGLLVAFFHHLSAEIRVESIIFQVHGETVGAIARELGEGEASGLPAPEGPTTATVAADRPGRVAWIDEAALEGLALATGGTLAVTGRPGLFVARGDVVLRQLGGRPLDPAERHRALQAVRLETHRTMDQDLGFGLRQLADIALRALSPGINDPTTADEAILRSADLLRRLARHPPVDRRVVREGRVILLRPRATFEELLGLAVDQVRRAAEAQADVATMLTIATALDGVLRAARRPEDMAAVRRQARMVADAARRSVPEPADVARVEAAVARLV